jgi:hypothetical protein
MAVTRFEARKQLLVEESNAIGTSYLRAQLIPSPEDAEISNCLRDYVDVRLQYSLASTDRDDRQKAARARAVRLQDEFWSRAAAAAQKDPRSVPAGLLVQSLNTVIDLESARWAASMNHVPGTVIFVVGFVALLSAVLVGYLFGLGDRRHHPVVNSHPDCCHYSRITCSRRPRPAGSWSDSDQPAAPD